MSKLIKLNRDAFHGGKIAVKFSKLYQNSVFDVLLDMSFDEILKYLQEHDFKKAVDTSYLENEGFYLIEKVLNTHVSRIYKEIFVSARGNNKLLLESYYLKYQIHNLMALIRCRISGEKEFESFLIGDERKKEKFIKAYEMSKLEDAISYISKKIYLDSNKVLEYYSKGIYILENYLYKEYYSKIYNFKFSYNGLDEKKFFQFIRTYIDLLNARTYLRLKVEKNSGLEFEDVFMSGGKLDLGYFLNYNNLEIVEILKEFDKVFGNIEVCDNTMKENLCLVNLDRRINLHKKETDEMFKLVNFASPFYSLKYLFKVERETSKLRILLKSKYLGLEKKEIRGLL